MMIAVPVSRCFSPNDLDAESVVLTIRPLSARDRAAGQNGSSH
jgi:hypothetical protein